MTQATADWYVALGNKSVGPIPTETVIRGIESRKVPLEAKVCRAGDSHWSELSDFLEFRDALVKSSAPPQADVSATTLAESSDAPSAHASRPRLVSEAELVVDVTLDNAAGSSVDWGRRFHAYFLVASEVQLPAESALLRSLVETPRETFLHDEGLWNLALCLSFGSERLGQAAAGVFFEAIEAFNRADRIEWMCRTLRSSGFMPSGIPRAAGNRALDLLRRSCPPEMRPALQVQAEY